MKKAKKLISALLGICLTVSTLSVMPVNARGELVQGDVDNSGKFSVVDLVAVSRWLHNPQFFKDWQYYYYQWKNADWNEDGKVNVIDLALMKRALIEDFKILNPILDAKNLSESVNAQSVEEKELDENFILKQTEFYLNLMQKTAEDGTNTLISPYSVVQALAMTANGADGQTLSEMENVIGGGMSMDELNPYLYTQRTAQPNKEYCKLLTANSIWCRDYHPDTNIPFVVKEDFLQTNKNFYDSDVFTAPFDEITVNDINNWTKAHTDKMIPQLIEDLPEYAVMCLVNAVTFDAKWGSVFEDSYEVNGWFTNTDGSKQDAFIMTDKEYRLLSDEHSKGFMKFYKDGRYAFVAMLPEEGMTTTEYLNTLTADSLHNTLANPEYIGIEIKMPKFSYEYEIHLPDTLKEMGMPTAFDKNNADFSRMAEPLPDCNISISDVIHKTFIDVTEDGTRAAAATIVMMTEEPTEPPPPEETIILNRPFVYYIVDTITNLPVFMGTVESLE